MTLKAHAREIFMAGVKAASPDTVIRQTLHVENDMLDVQGKQYDLRKINRIFVVGAGKATAVMAKSVEATLGDRISGGIISVKYGHTADLKKIETIEAGHPVPDKSGWDAAQKIINVVSAAGKDDLVICLLSGGGSALLPLPAEGLRLEDKQDVTALLLSCGADITEINTVRKHMSGIKGGQLARAMAPAQGLCLVLSDVVGDDLSVIASGPCEADDSTFRQAWQIIETYRLENRVPERAAEFLKMGLAGEVSETPKPGAEEFENVLTRIVGSNSKALAACEAIARELGYHPLVLSAFFEGETHTLAGLHGAIARQIRLHDQPIGTPACILSGGESTLRLTGNGKGGRNQQAALAAALKIADLKDVVLLCGGTDGSDGPTDAAGAVVDGQTLTRAQDKGLDAEMYLRENNAYPFFEVLNDLVITGPTGTNVMDLTILLVG